MSENEVSTGEVYRLLEATRQDLTALRTDMRTLLVSKDVYMADQRSAQREIDDLRTDVNDLVKERKQMRFALITSLLFPLLIGAIVAAIESTGGHL